MLDYIIIFKSLLLANIVGVSVGYFSSCLIDHFVFEERMQTLNGSDRRIVNLILWYIAIVLAFSIMFVSFATFDYLLDFAPSYALISNIRFVVNESILSSFIFSFFCGISSTLIKIGEIAFAKYKKNKI